MTVENQNYQSNILEYAVNNCLDKLLPEGNEDALSVITNQSNELVWRIATEIHKESGHQIDFASIENILDRKSNLLENNIIEEQRAKANLKAIRLFKKAEKKRIRKEKEIADAKAREKLEAERLEQIVKQKKLDKERKEKEYKRLLGFKQVNIKINDNYESFDVFIRISNIIADFLQIDRETIKFNTYIMKDLGADELENLEIVMAIEEEFDIEISDDDIPSYKYENTSPCSSSRFITLISSYSSYEDWNIEKIFYLVVQKSD